ncbi:MAG: thiol:disulfide interchange protein DsbA/DsbL [Gammaproteobacteria bacterium]|nr:thiol:disulfide interchange protein DsbA/DsbL [Gammaproteobacteria bacterium]
MFKRLVVASLLAMFSLAAPATEYVEGVHYQLLLDKQPVDTGDQIEVRELFWYGCPHCFNLEPVLQQWLAKKPANVAFLRMPVVLRDSWAKHAQAYYTFEVLGVLDKLHLAFFKAIHEQHKHMADADAIADFAVAHGIQRQTFLDAYNSFAVDSKVRQARLVGTRYEANSVPTLIVDGRYRTSSYMAGGHADLPAVLDFLVAKAAAERGK